MNPFLRAALRLSYCMLIGAGTALASDVGTGTITTPSRRVVDQKQTTIDRLADVGITDSGQTFTCGVNGELIAIRFYAQKSPSPRGRTGSAVQVRVHAISENNVYDPTALASALVPRESIPETADWIGVYFQTPCPVIKNGDRYPGGVSFSRLGSGIAGGRDIDRAFTTIVEPVEQTRSEPLMGGWLHTDAYPWVYSQQLHIWLYFHPVVGGIWIYDTEFEKWSFVAG